MLLTISCLMDINNKRSSSLQLTICSLQGARRILQIEGEGFGGTKHAKIQEQGDFLYCFKYCFKYILEIIGEARAPSAPPPWLHGPRFCFNLPYVTYFCLKSGSYAVLASCIHQI